MDQATTLGLVGIVVSVLLALYTLKKQAKTDQDKVEADKMRALEKAAHDSLLKIVDGLEVRAGKCEIGTAQQDVRISNLEVRSVETRNEMSNALAQVNESIHRMDQKLDRFLQERR